MSLAPSDLRPRRRCHSVIQSRVQERQKRKRQRRAILAMPTPAGIDTSTFSVIRRVMLAIVDSGGHSALLHELRCTAGEV